MAYFVELSQGGLILGIYTDAVGYAPPPLGAVPISDENFKILRSGFDGYTFNGGVVSYVKPLAQAKAEQTALIEAAYKAANEAPIAYGANTFQADAGSVALMAQVASAIPSSSGIGWYDITNTQVLLTNAQFAELRLALLLRGQPLFAQKQARKESIRIATTLAEVQAVIW